MPQREKTVKCPQCQKRLSPQGLNGHLRFVHGVAAKAASTAVASAPREATMTVVLEKIAELGRTSDRLGSIIEDITSRAGIRRRLVDLVKELTEVRKQKDAKEWDASFFGPDEEKKMFEALEQVEQDLLHEMASLTARLREYSYADETDE